MNRVIPRTKMLKEMEHQVEKIRKKLKIPQGKKKSYENLTDRRKNLKSTIIFT